MFNYLAYNTLTSNILKNNFFEIEKNSDYLIVVQNNLEKYFYENNSRQISFENKSMLISLNELLEKIFITDSFILNDTKKIMFFFINLTEEQKLFFNIKDYTDAIGIALDFYKYYSVDFKDENIFKNIDLTIWQEEKLKKYDEIKKNLDLKLKELNYIPIDELKKFKNLNLKFLSNFKKIIFFDIIDFPFYFKTLFKELSKQIEIDFYIQLKKGEFDEENFKLNEVSLPDLDLKINIRKYQDNEELASHIFSLKKECNNFFSVSKNNNRFYNLLPKIFEKSQLDDFNNTRLYSIINSLKSLTLSLDFAKNSTLSLNDFKKYVFTKDFMDFFSFTSLDKKFIDDLIKLDFLYINDEILNNKEVKILLENNPNFQIKFNEIIEILKNIKNINNFEEMTTFFHNYFFNAEDKILFFEEDYKDIFDIFYEILNILRSNEDMEFLNSYSKVFKNNIGYNLFNILFKFLNGLTLHRENYKNDKISIKYLFFNKYLEKNDITILDLEKNIFPVIKNDFKFFTEQQKKKLSIKTVEEQNNISRYRFIQNITNVKNINLLTLENFEENIDMPQICFELLEKYTYVEIKKDDSLMKNFYNIYKKDIITKRKNLYIKKDESDFVDNSLKIGAYDFNDLKICPYKLFLNKIAKIEKDEEDDYFGYSMKILGIISHNILENIIKNNYKKFIEHSDNLILDLNYIENAVKSEFDKFKYKIDREINFYIETFLVKKLSTNICKFFQDIHMELKDKKIEKFYSEKSKFDSSAFIEEKIKIYLNGRVDLLINTNIYNEILDFKTGKENKEQLLFYNLMLFDSSPNTLLSTYNLWEGKKININLKEDENVDFKENFKNKILDFINSDIYNLSDKKSSCMNCIYKNICPKEEVLNEKIDN